MLSDVIVESEMEINPFMESIFNFMLHKSAYGVSTRRNGTEP